MGYKSVPRWNISARLCQLHRHNVDVLAEGQRREVDDG